MSEKKVEGGTLWNTPAGALPSAFSQLDPNAPLPEISEEEIAEMSLKIEERTRPYRTPAYRDPTWFWNRPWRY